MNPKTQNNSNGLILTLSFLSLLAAINAVLFNVAFPNISQDLHISSAQVSWIAIGYSMVVAIGSIIYGKLADTINIRKLFLIGISLFILGSILGFIKHDSIGIIIAARMLQASGGSAFITLAMISVRLMIDFEKRPVAFSFISVGIALAIGLDPLIGGAIISLFSWPFLFLVMIISVVAAWLLLAFMPKENKEIIHNNFDYLGAIMLFIFIATLLLGVNLNYLFLFVAAFMLVVLYLWFKKAQYPFIEIQLLKNLVFVRAITVGTIINIALLGVLFLLPLLLANIYHLSSLEVGIIFFIASIFSSLASLFVGRLLPIYGNIKIIYFGALLMALSLLLLYFFTGTILIGIATTFIFISYSTIQVALNSLVPLTLGDKVGLGLGVYNLANFIGMALGPALSSKILDSTQNYGYAFLFIVILVVAIFPLLFKLPISKKI
ncbi:MFS transporter (plasmid) [Ligilactobacillus salivarius]|uniref:MFS transporter n=1 Tax=Ligilactobacillus salivarius TaxID=1624 RepID=A0ABD7YY70_9LACO|nr:MFS transporter [Ligilactobacillus salivarius]WHS05101.1 MFS transporter [Ligilactobacillus salivarius]WHS08988.1 MFS transporter [Ligilactobacillus salivarius]WHS11210.1 MFS transporter [Ligilactobacillus salivarius]WHS15172.1 MFS transporter [Ligilactobacillus salivarius]WHS18596.1 MFS transporter [Ligilactobacillus salivarius]